MKTKKFKASVLVMSLLIMFAIVIITLSATLVSVRDRNISVGSGKSSKAFQASQTGIEKVMKVIIDLRGIDSVTVLAGSGITCNANKLLEGNGYTIELKDVDGAKINCDDSTKKIADISSIKSIGKEGDSKQRAIEAVVAQTSTPGIVGGCVLKESSTPGTWDVMTDTLWGNGCKSGSVTGTAYEICEDTKYDNDYECGLVNIFDYSGDHVSCVCITV